MAFREPGRRIISPMGEITIFTGGLHLELDWNLHHQNNTVSDSKIQKI